MMHQMLHQSELFSSLRRAFEDANSLPLHLQGTDVNEWTPCVGSQHQNEFCRLINQKQGIIEPCLKSLLHLAKQSQNQQMTTHRCFAGMNVSSVPIRHQGNIVAYLNTGQICVETLTERQFTQVIRACSKHIDLTQSDELRLIREAFFNSQQLPEKKYQGIVTLLSLIGSHLEAWLDAQNQSQPEAAPQMVEKAKALIDRQFAEDLSLKTIAEHAGASPYYLCRVFKEHTSQTLTEYISNVRIEAAKRELLTSHLRIGEIALEVGFQSLSQFNRTFSKLTGFTPSEFRKSHQRASFKRVITPKKDRLFLDEKPKLSN